MLYCDFCAATPVRVCYTVPRITHMETRLTYAPQWVACPLCAALVERGLLEALLERALATQCYGAPREFRQRAEKMLRLVYDKFLAHRSLGRAMSLEEGERQPAPLEVKQMDEADLGIIV